MRPKGSYLRADHRVGVKELELWPNNWGLVTVDNKRRMTSFTLVVATAAIVGGCSSEQYSRMCQTTESPYAQVFLCQQYYASDEGQKHRKQREKEERERANVFDNCMIDAKSSKTNRTKTDCVDFANELIPQGSY